MKKISLLISAGVMVASTSAYAWPDQNEFGQYCVRDMQTRGYAFLWNVTNEGKSIAKDETLGLKRHQDVLFISDIGVCFGDRDHLLDDCMTLRRRQAMASHRRSIEPFANDAERF